MFIGVQEELSLSKSSVHRARLIIPLVGGDTWPTEAVAKVEIGTDSGRR